MVAKDVPVSNIIELVANLSFDANHNARADVSALLSKARESKNSPAALAALDHLIANIEIAKERSLPLCQDCGYVTVFAEVGEDLVFDGSLEEAIQLGVARGYDEGDLRQSVIRDAFNDRTKFETERPAKVYIDLKSGSDLKITVMPKGGGSDNACRMTMLKPTADEDEIVKYVVDTVADSGHYACPPLFVGIGIGGSFDSVGLLAKRALLRDFQIPAKRPDLAALENRLMTEINKLGIGPAGLGGETTALGVSVLTDRTHMACLPVAVNISCNQLRGATARLNI